jgi:hypothetical protein
VEMGLTTQALFPQAVNSGWRSILVVETDLSQADRRKV